MYNKSKLKTVISQRHLDRKIKKIVENELKKVNVSYSNHNSENNVNTEVNCIGQNLTEIQQASDVGDNLSFTHENQEEDNSFADILIPEKAFDFGDSSQSCSNTNLANVNNFDKNDKPTIQEKLQNWAVTNNVSHSAVTDLLHILHEDYPTLPLDARTLLKTPRSLPKIQLDKGELVHFDLKNTLLQILASNESFRNEDTLLLSFNVDGLPIFHSSNTNFWTILCLIKNFNIPPFVVSIYCGSGKPNPLNIYLKNFIIDLKDLLDNGLTYESLTYSIQIHSFVCDSPAKAYIKCIKSHGGYSSCDKCIEEGTYVNNRVILQNRKATKRNDTTFRLLQDENHHHGISPLAELQIGMVTLFAIDYMHAVCLGVMRKLLNSWISGKLSVRLSARQVQMLSETLISLKEYIPVEINRKPRQLSELARWKATEFRTFLLYLGPFVLRDVIDKRIYEHFLLLHCGIFILVSSKFIKNFGTELPRSLLDTFVSHCENIYGLEYLIYNIHILIHLTDDVENFGALDNFSSFPFENYLGQIKKLIRNSNRPLHQIYNRLVEANLVVKTIIEKKSLEFLYEHHTGPILNLKIKVLQYKKLVYKDFALSVKSYSKADCFCLLLNGVVIEIHNICTQSNNKNEYILIGKEFMIYESLYDYPIHSSLLLYQIKNTPIKCLIFPYLSKNAWISFPLLHTI
ncbi:uncharacterized protein LOC114344887 [Diabrotica virgifera virgifera]|uniref:Transposase domain-containing protein n=1 Tax=Diabrotica virgifera virgifera TaxID=50390 RepID=A0ABM5KTT5_DIAVI|nr:uncharacterized protein LOC114344887 [Diabrotica virgifera virgifera]XP_050513605.1 uncharacterized protein LOC114344887 [Diabrotica virgifera virgifera]